MALLFETLTLRGVTLRNRIVMPPMCQYMASEEGEATEWHLVHYGARAVGGAGLVIVEATAVEARGRISTRDLGLWDDRQVEGLARIVRFCRAQGARVGIQIAHAGRKAFTPHKGRGPALPVAPSALPYGEGWVVPAALAREELDGVVEAFRLAAARAVEAGFDVLEVHAAHGYLLHEFLSPLSNRREDEYGGPLENRLRLPLRVLSAVRAVWPEERPLFVRVSATDYLPGGIEVEEMVAMARAFKAAGVDLVHVSSGGLMHAPIPVGPGYQVPLAARIRAEAGVPTCAVGLITSPEQAEQVLRCGQADLVALGRELLRHPHWPLYAAHRLGADVAWPEPYWRASLQPRR